MNQQTPQRIPTQPASEAVKSVSSTENPTPSDSTLVIKPQPAEPEIKSDPTETAQETFHQVTPKDQIPPELIPVPAQDPVIQPAKAAKGDDDLMSKEEKKS